MLQPKVEEIFPLPIATLASVRQPAYSDEPWHRDGRSSAIVSAAAASDQVAIQRFWCRRGSPLVHITWLRPCLHGSTQGRFIFTPIKRLGSNVLEKYCQKLEYF